MFRRVLSLILSLCVLMTSMPTWSIAAALAEGEEEVIVEVISEEPEEEEEEEPTPKPTEKPTPKPTEEPTPEPTKEPTPEPTEEPTPEPTEEPTPEPTEEPTPEPTEEPVVEETEEPVVEETEEPVVEETEEPEVEETEEPEVEEPRFVDGYAYVKADKDVYADDELTEVLGAFAEKTVVYVSDREETADEDQDVLTLRFACEEKLVKAYIAAKDVKPLDEDEAADYEDEAEDDGVHYEDDVYLLNAEFVLDGEEIEEPVVEETEEPVVEPTEEPVIEETEEPVVEPTEEPVVEETEEPVVEETEEPVVEETEEPVVEETETPADETVEGEGELEEYEGTCAHEQTYPSYIWETVGEVTTDAQNHTGSFTCVTITYCRLCDNEVSRTEPEEVTGTFAHEYMTADDGK